MQQSKIFFIGEDTTKLFPMKESNYDAELILQAHLSSTPDLIPGEQINPDNPRRWLLVRQEASIPAEKDGPPHWSLDHIFVDQDGIPTFVECKRSCDPRLRREVVAQMLDYAANGMEYWPKGKLRLFAEETCIASNNSIELQLQTLLQLEEPPSEEDQDAFWADVDINLKDGHLRLLFVSDSVPKELRRLVEFLNSKMADIEVLAIELKQFTNGLNNIKAFVPRVIGQTEKSQTEKTSTKKKYSSIEEQLKYYPEKNSFEKIILLAQQHHHIIVPGITNFSIKCCINDKLTTYAFCKPSPSLQFYTEYLAIYPELKSSIESILTSLGYSYIGKYTINVPLHNNGTEAIESLAKVIIAIDNYATDSDS